MPKGRRCGAGAGFVRVTSRFVHPSVFPQALHSMIRLIWPGEPKSWEQRSCYHVMPTTTLECYSVHTGTYTSIYTKNYIAYSLVHDPQGPDTGPPGFASREADPTGARGSRLKGLRKVLLVVGRD